MNILEHAWIIPAVPFATAGLLMLLGRRLKEPVGGILAFLAVGASFLLSIGALVVVLDEPGNTFVKTAFEWIPAGGFSIPASYRIDPLSIVMLLLVTGVGALIHLYAIGYMHGDRDYTRFFFYMNLFIGSMLLLVMADNYLVLFVGWELVGACSYLLIGFWYEDISKSAAAKKAVVTNRVGDFGFLIGLMLLFLFFGTLSFEPIFTTAPEVLTGANAWAATGICLALFLGVAAKSAQIPLFVWLPDAMAGPTPVSALIHAATMVTAGVYLIVRSNVLFALSDVASIVIVLTAAVTALIAALAAFRQFNIKKVLAYSTISQLGYMVAAAGIGARGGVPGYTSAQFHVLTHGFFKALLFLCAGSVIHAMGDQEDMRHMGGLRKAMPLTFWTYTMGLLAIAGIPIWAGFFSKDAILTSLFESGEWWGAVGWSVLAITAFLTAVYMFRQWFLVFHGEKHWDEGVHPHDPAWTMSVPLVVLAVLSFVGGFVLEIPGMNNLLHTWLEPVFGVVDGESLAGDAEFSNETLLLIIGSIAVAAIGVAVAWWVWTRTTAEKREHIAERLEPLPATLHNAFYFDEAYRKGVEEPGWALAGLIEEADERGIDRAVMDVGGGTKRTGAWLSRFQNGYVRYYAGAIGLGTVALLGWAFARGGL